MRLVADIGGTNARLALAEQGVIHPASVQSYANDDWPHFGDMLGAYLSQTSAGHLADMVIAVAGPVQNDHAMLTNRNWIIRADDLMKAARCDRAVILNDLSALGYALPGLRPEQLSQVHCGTHEQGAVRQALVVGIGTGFNVSPVVMANGTVECLSVEAGHVSMPMSVARLLDDFGGLGGMFPTVEDLFSGRGFTAFCRKLCNDTGLRGSDVISAYGRPQNNAATTAVERFANLLGQILRELDLAYMPNGGIYLAGSVSRAILGTAPSQCTEIFARPCTIRSGKSPNLFVITDDGAALHGCASLR